MDRQTNLVLSSIRDDILRMMERLLGYDHQMTDSILNEPGKKIYPFAIVDYIESLKLPNRPIDIQTYFSEGAEWIDICEFHEFWYSMGMMDRLFYMVTPLT